MKHEISPDNAIRANRLLLLILSVTIVLICGGVVSAHAQSGNASSTASPSIDIDTGANGSTDDISETPIDVTEQWSEGALTIDREGTYYLSGNVETDGTLTIAAPEGARIVFDFAGHSAKVAGEVVSGIDVSASRGTVEIIDSTYREETAAQSTPSASLTVEATGAKDAVCGIMWNQSESAKDATARLAVSNLHVIVELETADASISSDTKHDSYGLYLGHAYTTDAKTMDATVVNCTIESSVIDAPLTDDETAALQEKGQRPLQKAQCGTAAAIFAKVGGIRLDGRIATTVSSDGTVCNLYSSESDAFTLLEDFIAGNALKVYTGANREGEAFASLSDGRRATDELAAAFFDATGKGLVSSADGSQLVFRKAPINESTARSASAAQGSSQMAGTATTTEDGTDAAVDETAQSSFRETEGTPEGNVFKLNGGDNLTENEQGVVESSTAGSSLSACFEPLATAESEGTDLTAAWKKLNGFASTYTITAPGTYYLSADTDVAAALFINCSGTVTIEFRGHKLTSSITGLKVAGISVRNANAKVIIDGTVSGSQYVYSSKAQTSDPGGVPAIALDELSNRYPNASLDIEGLDVYVKPSDTTMSYFSSYGIYAYSGNLKVNDCTIEIDQSNQTTSAVANGTTDNSRGNPTGIYVGSAVTSAEIDECDVTVTASPAFTTDDGHGLYAYGINSQSTTVATVVKGGSYTVSSPLGTAIGIIGSRMDIENADSGAGPSMTLKAKETAAGIQGLDATQTGALEVNATLTVNYDTAINTSYRAALYSRYLNGVGHHLVQKAFSIGPSFAGSTLGVLMRSYDGTGDNPDGGCFALYTGTLDSARRTQLEGILTDALGAEAACTVAADSDGLYLRLASAGALIVNGAGSVSYTNAAAAIAAAMPGDTVRLLKDAGAVAFNVGQSGESYTLDLNGHTMVSLADSSSATLTVETSEAGGRIADSDAAMAAIDQSGSGTLIVDGVDISCHQTSAVAYGVLVEDAGRVEMRNAALDCSTDGSVVYGFYLKSGNGGTLALDSSAVSVSTTSTSDVYGICAVAGSSTLTLTNSPIDVAAGTGNAYAVCTAGTFEATADEASDTMALAVTTSGVAASAWGICATGDGEGDEPQNVSLKNYSVRVTAESGFDTSAKAYWCLAPGSGSATKQYPTRWTLDGACDFQSSNGTDICQYATPIGVGTELNASSGTLTVRSLGLTDDVFAVASDGASDITGKAGCFTSAAGSAYEGWTVRADSASASQLSWAHDPIVKNLTSGETFPSLSKAVAAAKNGETLQLIADSTFYDVSTLNLSDGRTVTLDLDGRKLTGDVAGSGTAGALVLAGTGTLIVKDSQASAATGGIDLYAGSSNEIGDVDYRITYRGIVVTGGSTLDMQSGAVSVTYVGVSSQIAELAPEVTLYGIDEQNGTVRIAATASVTANACKDGAALGASDVYAIYGSDTAAGGETISVSAGASVTASDTFSGLEKGKVFTASGDSINTENYMKPNLIQIYPEKGSELYNQIQAKFREVAEFDDTTEESSEGYDTRVYYAAPLTLDDGTAVWAFTDSVAAGKQGTETARTATTFFMQSTYTIVPSAHGIGAADGFTGDVRVEGSVVASCTVGNAYAVDAAGTGKWTVNGASLTATGGASTYRGQTNRIDLRDYLTISTSGTAVIFYPKNAVGYLVEDKNPIAEGLRAASDKTTVELDGICAIIAEAAHPCDVEANLIHLGDSFALPDGTAFYTVGDPDGANASGNAFAQSATTGGQLTQAQRGWFKDVDGKLTVALDSNARLAWTGLYTVSFASDTGTVQTNASAAYGDTIALPDEASVTKSDTDTTTYTFAGWSLDAGATSIDAARGDIPAAQTTISVTGDATYYAVYTVAPRALTYTFTGMKGSDGTARANLTGTSRYGEALSGSLIGTQRQVLLDMLGSSYTTNGKTYRFVGWQVQLDGGKTIIWDPQSIVSTLVFDEDIYGVTSGQVTIRAYYLQVNAGSYLVQFKVDDTIRAAAVPANTTPSYATISGTNAETPTKSTLGAETGYDYTFQGWYAGWTETVDNTTLTGLIGSGQIPKATGDATYTACFGKKKAKGKVSFEYWQESTVTAGRYVYKAKQLKFEYGDDMKPEVDKLVKIGDTFVQDYKVYTFLGWSLRQSDTDPVYTDTLPTSTATSDTLITNQIYYGIYATTAQTVNVSFYADGQKVASIDDVAGNSTFDGAFSVSGAAAPADKSASSVFKGWAVKDSATTADGTTKVGDAAGVATSLNLYAVYGAPNTKTVTFYKADGKTVLADVAVVQGSTVSSANASIVSPSKSGYYFTGWADGSGNAFEIGSTAVQNNIKVYPQYRAIGTDTGNDTGTAISVASAYLTADEVRTAADVEFQLLKANAADANVAAKVASEGYTIQSSYQARLHYTIGSTDAYAGSGFGSVSLTLPVSGYDGRSVKVYWLGSDGSTVNSLTETPNDGTGTLTLALKGYSYTTAGGNLVVALSQTALELNQPNLLAQLKAAYESYSKTDYTADNWDQLGNLYATGVSGVQGAAALGDAVSAVQTAIDGMKAIAKATAASGGSSSASLSSGSSSGGLASASGSSSLASSGDSSLASSGGSDLASSGSDGSLASTSTATDNLASATAGGVDMSNGENGVEEVTAAADMDNPSDEVTDGSGTNTVVFVAVLVALLALAGWLLLGFLRNRRKDREAEAEAFAGEPGESEGGEVSSDGETTIKF